MPPKKKDNQLYSVRVTNIWFAIVSVALLGSLIWMVKEDYSREWKDYQKEFVHLKLEKAEEKLHQAEKKVSQEKLSSLQENLKQAQDLFKSHQSDYEAIQKEIAQINLNIRIATKEIQKLDQFKGSFTYFHEKYLHQEDARAEEYKQKIEAILPKIAAQKSSLEQFQAELETKEAQAAEFKEQEKIAAKQIDSLLRETEKIKAQIEKLEPSLTKDLLNAPMLDFINPTFRVQQVVLEDLYDNYHFAKVNKVDRCTTCHLGIDLKEFENAPQPFTAHPNLELYLSSKSAHPIEQFGCTVCHSGSGHSVDFTWAAHTPNDEEQAKEWKKKYHWHELHKWDAKMLPKRHLETSCNQCHSDSVSIPQASKLNKGRQLAQTYGCFNCHKVDGFRPDWKVGPSLVNIRSKVDKEWIEKWLNDPKGFRKSTKMPQVFHLENSSSEEDREKSYATIESIGTYLMTVSETVPLQKPPVSGDIPRGKKLVETVGCLGCHSTPGVASSSFGPELSGIGSKVNAEWLYTWVKNPKHYNQETRMPSFRLNDQEAADITSYLLSLKNPKFEQTAAPTSRPEVLDDLVLYHLQKMQRREQAESELRKMSRQSKLMYLGKKSIAHQGCYSCHTIKGFEEAKPVGTELTYEGSKDLHQFDFGHTNVEHSRAAWIFNKIKSPRIYDQDKEKPYYDKLKMPDFNFTNEEAEAITTFVLSLTKDNVPSHAKQNLTHEQEQIEQGRLLASKHNCQGCHTFDGKEGLLRELAKDKGEAPPILHGQGAKVQEKWFHEFLKDPSTIRPWLEVRMPTFGFSDEETEQLVRYFAYLDNQAVSYHGYELPASTPEKLAAGKQLFEALQCIKCHQVNANTAAMGSSFLAPDLTFTKDRLKPDWVVDWLKDPQALMEGTMMPGFFPDGQTPLPDVLGGDAQAQMEAMRDYLYHEFGIQE